VGFGLVCGMLIHEINRDGIDSLHIKATVEKTPFPSFLLYAALLAVFLFPKSVRGLYPMIALATVVPAIVFIGAHIRPGPGLETNVARFLGWISYPIYCLHVPVVRLIVYARGGLHTPPYWVMLASATITIALAIMLTKWYEAPIRAALSGARRQPHAIPAVTPD
jgi:peptidoglycan/LPS O-acetylase OafA/YrhL